MSAGVWETAQGILARDGLRAALVYAEGEIRHFVSTKDVQAATQVTKLLVTLCNREAGLQPKTEAVVTLRRAKTALDYIERHLGQGAKYPESLFRLKLLTCNNLANVLKELGESRRAYQYLTDAQDTIERRAVSDSTDNLQCIASTKVNISTVQLDLKLYPEAIAFAEQCLELLQIRLALTSTSLAKLAEQDAAKYSSMLQSYLSAMFNIAIAEEELGRRDAAIKSYSACVTFGKTYLSESNPTVHEAESALSELFDPTSERDMTTAPSASSRPHLATKSVTQLSQTVRIPHKPEKPNEGYYTKERLMQLHTLLGKGGRKTFVSSSQYFQLQIKKNLQLEGDVKHLIPVSPKQLARTLRSQDHSETDPDKRSLAQLRQRKYRKRANSRDEEPHGPDYVLKRLATLHTEESRRMSSSMSRTEKGSSKMSRKGDSGNSDVTTSPTRMQRRLNAGKTKEEIEAMMGQLQTEIKSLSSSPDRQKPGYSPRSTTRSQLANSVLQHHSRTHTRLLSGSQPPSKPPDLLSHSDTEATKRKTTVTFQRPANFHMT